MTVGAVKYLAPLFAMLIIIGLSIILLGPKFNADRLQKVELVDTPLTAKNIQKYPFLESLAKEIAIEKAIYEEWQKTDMQIEGIDYIGPKVSIAEATLNKQSIIITEVSELMTGSTGRWLCGNTGCGKTLYKEINSDFKPVGNVMAFGLQIAHCDNLDYLILLGGGGAGITKTIGSIWAFENDTIFHMTPISKMDITTICATIKELRP